MTHNGFRTAFHGRRTAIAALVVVGLLTSACTSSSSSIATSPPVTTTTPPVTGSANAYGAMVDIRTGEITPLPASIAHMGHYFAVSPDHTTLAFSPGYSATNTPLYTANIDGTQLSQVSPDPWDGFAAQWSPDGSMLVYQQRLGSTGHLGNLFVWNVATGQRTRVTNLDQTHDWGYWFLFPSFAADGRSILFQMPRGKHNNPGEDLWSVPVTGGQQTLVRRNAQSGYYSPDGKWLAYFTHVSGQDQLSITSVHGGKPRLVHRGTGDWMRWSPDSTRISYSGDNGVYVLNVGTGLATKVAVGGRAEWFDDNTLIVANASD